MDIITLALAKKFAKEYTDTHASKLTEEDAIQAVANYFNENPDAIVTNDELETVLTELEAANNELKESITEKLSAPTTGLEVGKYFRIAAIDENGHVVLECADISLTTDNIESALGYTPADSEAVTQLQEALIGVSDLIGGEV